MSRGTRSVLPRKTLSGLVLVLLFLLAAVTACEDLTSTSSVVSTSAETTTPTTDSATTVESTVGSTATNNAPPDVLLGEDDFSREVRLQVGERVRIELPAKVSEKVVSVEWKYEPIIVEERDSGTTLAGDFVTECWLELVAVAEGRVTIRTVYERSNGTTRTLWVVYLEIEG